jgi:hypothetical protein
MGANGQVHVCVFVCVCVCVYRLALAGQIPYGMLVFGTYETVKSKVFARCVCVCVVCGVCVCGCPRACGIFVYVVSSVCLRACLLLLLAPPPPPPPTCYRPQY